MTLLEKEKWLESKETSFEKEGRNISYRNIFIVRPIDSLTAHDIEALQTASVPRADLGRRSYKNKTVKTSRNANTSSLLEPLKQWRLVQARKKNIPAFRILTDRALEAICDKRPISLPALLEISSINRKTIIQYGEDILRVIRRFSSTKQSDRDFSNSI